jgi:precorrin-6A/cobalt-precorrin-6A reductase
MPMIESQSDMQHPPADHPPQQKPQMRRHRNALIRALILGGTTEASRLARAMADAGLQATLSYAGRTEAPAAQPVAVRIGGFGGAGGLAQWLQDHAISHIIDASHPFAAQISRNAITASAATGIPLIALERPAWQPGPGDNWQAVPDLAGAAARLAGPPQRIFLAIGRQNLGCFASMPQHHYLLRLVDPPVAPLPLPDCTVVIARGPFEPAQDRALLQRHRIGRIIAKNAGGAGAEAKLIAARELGLPVLMINRPPIAARETVASVQEVMARLHADLGV